MLTVLSALFTICSGNLYYKHISVGPGVTVWLVLALLFFPKKKDKIVHCTNKIHTHTMWKHFSHHYQTAVRRFRHWSFHSCVFTMIVSSCWAFGPGWRDQGSSYFKFSQLVINTEGKKKKHQTWSSIQRRKKGLCCWEGLREARPPPDLACDGIHAHPLCQSLCTTEVKALWVRCIIKQH